MSSVRYLSGVTSKEDKMAFLMEVIKFFQYFVTVENEELKYKLRTADDFKDFGSLNESRRRTYLTKTGAGIC